MKDKTVLKEKKMRLKIAHGQEWGIQLISGQKSKDCLCMAAEMGKLF